MSLVETSAGWCLHSGVLSYTLLSAPAHKELTLDLSGGVGGGSARGVFVQVGVESRDGEGLRFGGGGL